MMEFGTHVFKANVPKPTAEFQTDGKLATFNANPALHWAQTLLTLQTAQFGTLHWVGTQVPEVVKLKLLLHKEQKFVYEHCRQLVTFEQV
jgi:hypothetical protein